MFDRDILCRCDLLAEPGDVVKRIAPSLRYTDHHEYIIREAQKRLKGRGPAELTAGALHLEGMLRVAEGKAFDAAMTKMIAGAKKARISDPIGFTEMFEDFDLENQHDFPDATPITYFALLALIYALESLEDIRSRAKSGDGAPDEWNMERTLEAREMIAFIQGMEFEGIFRRKISASANKARSAQFEPLKDKVLRFADEQCQGVSNRESGRRAYIKFQDEADKVLRTDDRARRLEIWIGEHRKPAR